MALRFTIAAAEGTVAGTYREETYDSDTVVFGRDPDVDVQLPDPEVSRRHARVSIADDGFELEDLHSRHGTRLNGKRLLAGQLVPLRVGDEIVVGPFLVQFGGEVSSPGERDTRAVARSVVRRLAPAACGAEEVPCLRVTNGPAAGTRYPVEPGAMLRVGRGRECEVCVDDARVSRLHAVVHSQDGGVWISDAGSTNGISVDDEQKGDVRQLVDGAIIGVGRIRLVLDAAASTKGAGAEPSPGWLVSGGLLIVAAGILVAALL